MRARTIAPLAVLVSGALILASCAGAAAPTPSTAESPAKETPKSEAPGAAAETPKSAEKTPETAPRKERSELTVAFSAKDPELNPLKSFQADEAQIFTGLYEGLFTYNPLTLEPVPALASSWDVSDDKKTWTFNLRENARYWNGDRVLASHIRDTWLEMIDPAAEAPYSSLFDFIEGAKEFRLKKIADTAKVGIKVKDEKTLVVTLGAPAAYFPRVLCHHSFAPVHPDMRMKKDWSTGPVISNGPYYIAERTPAKLVMAKNPLYWDAKKVSIPRIVILFAQKAEDAASLYDSGIAQWVAGDVDLDKLKDKRGISVNAMFATHYYYIRSADKPWSDKRVRRALSLALPWKEIRKEHLLPAPTLVYPIPGYPKLEGIAEGNVAEAKKALAEAGFNDAAALPPVVLRITPSKDAARIADLMSKAWTENLGLKVKIDVVPFDDYYPAMKKSDYVVGSSTWIGDFADPYTFLQMWRADSNLNDAQYNDSEYEKLVDKSMTQEGEERYKTLSEAEKLLLDGGVVLPISYTPAVNVIDTNEIDGWFPNPLDMHPFKYLQFAAFKPLPGVAAARP